MIEIKHRYTGVVLFTSETTTLREAVLEALKARIRFRGADLSDADLSDAYDDHTEEACGTTHCRAGWAVVLAGEAGRELEKQHGPETAGRMIYLASTGRAPHFFASTERALEDIRKCAARQTIANTKPTEAGL